MRKHIHILFALGMIALGVGVVRPQAEKMISEAWKPVLDGMQRVPAADDKFVEIDEPGSYVVFLEGPADAPAWQTNDTYVQLVDRRGKDVLPSQIVDYEYETGGRRGQGIVKVRATTAGSYEVSFSSTQPELLANGGFQFGIAAADLVKDQSWKATQCYIGAIAVAAMLGVFAVFSFTQRPQS